MIFHAKLWGYLDRLFNQFYFYFKGEEFRFLRTFNQDVVILHKCNILEGPLHIFIATRRCYLFLRL